MGKPNSLGSYPIKENQSSAKDFLKNWFKMLKILFQRQERGNVVSLRPNNPCWSQAKYR